jgi:hypothetical protein
VPPQLETDGGEPQECQCVVHEVLEGGVGDPTFDGGACRARSLAGAVTEGAGPALLRQSMAVCALGVSQFEFRVSTLGC